MLYFLNYSSYPQHPKSKLQAMLKVLNYFSYIQSTYLSQNEYEYSSAELSFFAPVAFSTI